MNILLLGNGYDLNYNLPTSYRNFLLTIDFLIKSNLDNIHTVGDVFGNVGLHNEDEFIARSYAAYKETYAEVSLDTKTLEGLVDRAKRNIWFSYFLRSFNREAGWIDVEREIAFVVSRLQSFFDKAEVNFLPSKVFEKVGSKYIIMEAFNFFVAEDHYSRNALPTGIRKIKPEYTVEYPLGSGDHVINKEKIIGELNDALIEFAEILKTYLQCFIDKTVEKLVEQGTIAQLHPLAHTDVVITFNYTNTYESFGSAAQVFHIHGNVKDKIVLGINPDKNDEKETINTDFVAIKKYFQRTYYGTDTPYLRWLCDLLNNGGGDSDIHLLVMGHSLDVTDEDIIRGLFGLASEITVIYHSESSKSSLIRNLVTIFGKAKFDQIRDDQLLDFLPLSMDFSEFIEKQAGYSTIRYESELEGFL